MVYFCKTSGESLKSTGIELIGSHTAIPVINISGELVPIFAKQEEGKNEFSVTNAALIHKNAMDWLHETHGTSEEDLRQFLMGIIKIKINSPVKRILVTGVGEGNDLPYLFNYFTDAEFYIQDIAEEMLREAIVKSKTLLQNGNLHFWLGDACDLPFEDGTFDLVYHFGGLNLFKDPGQGVQEMHRVGAVGSCILFGDEGIAPFMRNTEIGRALIKNNPLYTCEPPINFIPNEVKDFSLQYFFNNCFYVVSYLKTIGPEIDIEVPHKGRRGGTIKTRYYGQLEGVDPGLRDAVYEKAEHLGVSRVEYLERLLRSGLNGDD